MECPRCKALEIGAYVIPCIGRWCWAGFRTEDDAESFVEWLEQWGHDNRGIHSARPGEDGRLEWLVRFLAPKEVP